VQTGADRPWRAQPDEQAAAGTCRVETLEEREDGIASVRKSEVSGAWLRALLLDWGHGRVGEGEVILSVREVEDPVTCPRSWYHAQC